MLLNLAMGFISRIFDYKHLPLVALFWFGMSIILGMGFGGHITVDLFWMTLLKTAIVYLWLVILKGTENNTLGYLILLALGAYLITLI